MLEKYRPGKKTGLKGSPDRSFSNLLLVGAFGLAFLVAKPGLFSDYNGIMRIGCLLLVALGAHRSK